MSKFSVETTALPCLMRVQREAASDQRGFFSRFFCAEELSSVGFNLPIAQINHTFTSMRGSVRGLHFQSKPFAEDKFVSCLRGKVFDVAVDLRKESPTFLKWHAEILSAENMVSLLIPQGFAHGFQTLIDDCELIYLHSKPYSQQAEGALNVNDPRLAIAWPLPITNLSERDAQHSFVCESFTGI
jgi:dTDP-4-dehydrorhamnose 3,5-epimerase